MSETSTSETDRAREAIETARERAEAVGLPVQGLSYEYKTENSVFDEKWHSELNWSDIDRLERKLTSDNHGLYAVRNIEPLYSLDRIELAAQQGWLDEFLEQAGESDGDSE